MKIGLFTRVILFTVVTLMLLYGWLIPAFLLIMISGVFYNAYEYLFMAFCVDCYFSPEPVTFWYTIMATIIVFVAMVVRPYVRIYEADLD